MFLFAFTVSLELFALIRLVWQISIPKDLAEEKKVLAVAKWVSGGFNEIIGGVKRGGQKGKVDEIRFMHLRG